MYRNPITENSVSGLKFQLNCLYTTEAEFALLRTQAKFYEDGERASKLVASRLNKAKTRNIITAVKDKFGNLIVNELQINYIYREYFEQLYQSDITTPNHDSTNQKAELFLDNINIPTIADEDQKNLVQEIISEEINSAIRQMAAGKSPGIDGFPK